MKAVHFLRGFPIAMAVVVVASTGCQLIVSSGDYAVGSDNITSADGSSGGDATSSGSSGGSSGSSSGHGTTDAGPHVGDPCATATDCPHGTTCQGTWCTQPCVSTAQCGINSVGQGNLCVMTAGGKACVPGCSTDADCTQYGTGSTCTAASTTASYCNVPSTTASDSSSSSGGPSIGDPCTTDADCASPATCLGAWCSTSCTPTPGSCGSTSLGQPNSCVQNKNDSYVCFPGCQNNASCYSYSGTTCQPITTSSSVCSRTAGVTGDPCSTTSSTTWNPCVGADGGVDSNACTIGGAACSKYCTTDADCGTNSAGQVNFCVQITDTDGGTPSICFPGCTQYSDCAPYSGGYCQSIYKSSRGFICAGTGGAIGDPCTTDIDCTDAAATCPNGWCTQPCSSVTDTSCGTNDANGQKNSCVFDTTAGQYMCQAGCLLATDCLPYAGTTCNSVAGGMKACSL